VDARHRLFRGLLGGYKPYPLIQKIVARIRSADVVKDSIADNRMFEIIDEFIDGEIADEQRKHRLAAMRLENRTFS